MPRKNFSSNNDNDNPHVIYMSMMSIRCKKQAPRGRTDVPKSVEAISRGLQSLQENDQVADASRALSTENEAWLQHRLGQGCGFDTSPLCILRGLCNIR